MSVKIKNLHNQQQAEITNLCQNKDLSFKQFKRKKAQVKQ